MVDAITPSQNTNTAANNSETMTPNSPPQYNPNLEFQMAKLWHRKGKTERAIAGYRKALALDPTHWLSLLSIEELLVAKGEEKTALALYRQALLRYQQILQSYRSGNEEKSLEQQQQALEIKLTHPATLRSLEELLIQKGELPAAITAYRQALEQAPNEAELHKRHINLIVAEEGIEAAYAYYELIRADEKAIEISPSALLCCVVVRNELPRLPYFLDYYRQKGVDKFLIVDNLSTDGTLEYLRQQDDVYVWSSAKSFNQVNFGSVWFELLLRRYGIDRWCLTVDADELFYYPDCETKTIPQLCGELDRRQQRAYTAILLDMYGEKAIQDTRYTPGENFLEVCPYFDRQYYHRKFYQAGPYSNQTIYFGGVRERVFGTTGEYLLSKVPLLKYGLDMVMSGGQHFTNLPESRIAKESGCLLHFKYFSFFTDYVATEVKRKEHYGGGHQYTEYFRTLDQNSALSLYDENQSIWLENSQQLVELGIMTVEAVYAAAPLPEFPKIAPLSPEKPRPFWSVMITAYQRLDYLEQALKSVLAQAPSEQEMQIEVINDGAPIAIAAQIEALVKQVGGNRVQFYRHPKNIGHPYIFNLCIERAQGKWLHLLHDDDWVAPGFYAALQAGIEREPAIGSACCRFQIVKEAGEKPWFSHLERPTSGIIPHWLDRIATYCRLQFPAVVVKREVYEHLGGFTAGADSAFDWEMWQRIALHYRMWYEPQTLAYFRDHQGSASYDLMGSGQQIKDSRAAIALASTYLPRTTAPSLTEKARENLALWGLQLAKGYFGSGKTQAALANIQEAIECSQSQRVQKALTQVFRDI